MRTYGWLALALVAACDKGGDADDLDGTEDLYGCLVSSTEPVTDGAATPDGFTASVDALLAGVAGTFAGTITHPDDSTEDLVLSVVVTGDPVIERRDWQDDGGGGMELALDTAGSDDCPDDVKVAAELSLVAEGSLDEAVAVDLIVDTEGSGRVYASIDLGDLVGDAAPLGFDPAEMAETTFQVTAASSDDAWSGSLSFQGESFPSGTGDDSVVSATNDEWGTFAADRVAVME